MSAYTRLNNKSKTSPLFVVGVLVVLIALVSSLVLVRFSIANEQEGTQEKTENALAQQQESSSAPLAVDFDGSAKKQEIIYAKLKAEGAIQSLYAVNTFQPDDSKSIKDRTVQDFGSYSEVTNLTDSGALRNASNGVIFTPTQDTFSYQGKMVSLDLPWSLVFEYRLDGAQILPADLAGKSGHLEIVMHVSKNDAVDATYFDNYVLQATCSLETDRAKNIKTDDGSIALAGSSTQVNFMVLPGKEVTCTLSADVNNFEMEGISVAAVPLSMSIDSVDASGMVSNFNQLISGTAALEQGSADLNSGIAQFASGVKSLDSGISELNAQAQSLSNGVKSYTENVNGVSKKLAEIVTLIKQQDPSQVVSVDDLKRIYSALEAMDESEKAALETALGLEVGSLDSLQSTLGSVIEYIDEIGGIEALLDEAESGLNQLSQAGEDLSSGMGRYADGMNSLASSSSSLASGAGQLALGSENLAQGIGELHAQSQGIPNRIQTEIDAMLSEFDKSDYRPKSFTSSKNTNVTLVQFVMSTEAISVPEPEKEQHEEANQSIVDRFFALFS